MPGRNHPLPAHQRATLAGALPASPTIEAIEQEPAAPGAVRVAVDGTVQTHRLPAKRSATSTSVVAIPPGTPLLGSEPKRSRVILISTDKPFYYATNSSALNSVSSAATAGCLWPANVALVLENSGQVYVASADAMNPATIGMVIESWAD